MTYLTQVDFVQLNRTMIIDHNFKFAGQPLGYILSSLIPYLFILAGMFLFVYLILGGFQLMVSRGDPKAVEAAKGKITNAIIGFVIIFASFWIVQILQKIFGLGSIFG